MTLRNSWPGPSGVTTTTDARIVVGGIVEDAAGVVRAGVFPSNLNPVVTARSDMNVDIAAFTGVTVQFGGPIFVGNDGTIQLPAVLVSPASGTNYYVTYTKQDESTSPGTDLDNLPNAGSVLSTVSFAAARALLPTGALELATVQVPSGVSATNAAGVIITQTFVYTAAEGGVVPVRNSTELAAWTPADGSLAWEIDTRQLWERAGGVWLPVFPVTVSNTSGIQGGITTATTVTGLSLTVTLGASQNLLIEVGMQTYGTSTDDVLQINIMDGATLVGQITRQANSSPSATATSNYQNGKILLTSVPAGTHTYTIQVARATGTGTITVSPSATCPSFLAVQVCN